MGHRVAARAAGWYRHAQIYGGFYGGGLTFTLMSAVMLVATVSLPSRSEVGVGAVYVDGAKNFLPYYQLISVYVVGVLAICHRSAVRDWKWWTHTLVMLGWLAGYAGALALVAWLLW